ncbi:hypothetical protein PDESU_01060 [Pontiella desulfatans]|uniref:PEP-CTERM protein-sorting domain-containing protein n=1 Tax=Pontiella desulfatans TaxID=2750659 RepID=A0A6C2TY34_PONDE|nr:PEP-CTERM sorting domain-containing protein [Pontiella desulfatans]VGO12507.1 hypothetical protein PDESU_01060 [Pontiella desulfatans]
MMKKTMAGLLCLVFASSGYATNYTRDAGDTSWSNLGQWNDNSGGSYANSTVMPGASDTVLLNGGKVLTVDSNVVIGTIVLPNATSDATLQLTNNFSLTASTILVGHDTQAGGHGLLTHSDGTIDSGSVTVRAKGTGTGTYNLSDTAVLNATTFTMGSVNATAGAGTGESTMNQSGGTATLTTANLGGIGNSFYNMTGGTLSGATLNVGNAHALAAGTTTMEHSAGVVSSATVNVGGTGTSSYNLSGSGALSPATAINVGATAGKAGALNQSGGTASTSALNVGTDGAYNLTGGTLTTTGTAVTVNGQLDINGGTWTIEQDLANVTIDGNGLLTLQSGTLETTGTDPTDLLLVKTDIEVSGGTMNLIGQARLNAELKILGDAATISLARLGSAGGGTANFIFDDTGVSTVNVSAWMTLDDLDLIVDGSAYTGSETSFVLLDAVNNTASLKSYTVTGFGTEGVDWELVQTLGSGNSADVVLNIIPEPATLGLIAAFGGGMLFIRRRFMM